MFCMFGNSTYHVEFEVLTTSVVILVSFVLTLAVSTCTFVLMFIIRLYFCVSC